MSGDTVFARLRAILSEHAAGLTVTPDTKDHYGLEAPPGPATLRAWHGKIRKPQIPVAWVERGPKAVSYHLMGLPGLPEGALSKELNARRQGKTCFRFTDEEPALLTELAVVTAQGIAALRQGGFIASRDTP